MGSATYNYMFIDGTGVDDIDVTVSTPAADVDGFGQGYAVTSISGSILGKTIEGEIGSGGSEQRDANGITYDNSVFTSNTSGTQANGQFGSSFGLDADGLFFHTLNNYYNLYFDKTQDNFQIYIERPATANNITLISSDAPCYCTGSLIRTSGGDVAVEALAIGDMVVTASGEHRRIKWIGHRRYSGRFANANPDILPICFKVGSLAEGVPSRDLWVSPKHAMFLSGVLVPAEHLVNGTSVVKAKRIENVEYWHVELDSHDVLIAEGAAAESFVDDEGRGIFHNAHTFRDLYPDARPREAIYCAPRVEDGYVLEAIRKSLATRAGLPVPVGRRFGVLRGYVDGCSEMEVWGWAQDLAHPDAPVCLDIVVDGTVVGLVYADRFREDLATGGIGDGRHAFHFALPEPLSMIGNHTVEVRRSADREALRGRSHLAAQTAAA